MHIKDILPIQKGWFERWGFVLLIGFLSGFLYGESTTRNIVYQDCRVAGVTRMGKAAFKCQQFSNEVLLIPEDTKKGK